MLSPGRRGHVTAPLGSLLSGQRGRLSSAETSSLSASPLVGFCSRFLRALPLDLSEIVHGRALYRLRGGRDDPFSPGSVAVGDRLRLITFCLHPACELGGRADWLAPLMLTAPLASSLATPFIPENDCKQFIRSGICACTEYIYVHFTERKLV